MPEFEDFVYSENWGGAHRMSSAIEARYGSGDNVHCMITTHNMEAELLGCLQKFQACGGSLKQGLENETALVEAMKGAMSEATDIAHAGGRSVGDHPKCSELFNKDMEKSVLATEQKVVDKFHLEKCCSS